MLELSLAAHCLCGFDTVQCSKTDIILPTLVFCRHNGVAACTYVITLYRTTVCDPKYGVCAMDRK